MKKEIDAIKELTRVDYTLLGVAFSLKMVAMAINNVFDDSISTYKKLVGVSSELGQTFLENDIEMTKFKLTLTKALEPMVKFETQVLKALVERFSTLPPWLRDSTSAFIYMVGKVADVGSQFAFLVLGIQASVAMLVKYKIAQGMAAATTTGHTIAIIKQNAVLAARNMLLLGGVGLLIAMGVAAFAIGASFKAGTEEQFKVLDNIENATKDTIDVTLDDWADFASSLGWDWDELQSKWDSLNTELWKRNAFTTAALDTEWAALLKNLKLEWGAYDSDLSTLWAEMQSNWSTWSDEEKAIYMSQFIDKVQDATSGFRRYAEGEFAKLKDKFITDIPELDEIWQSIFGEGGTMATAFEVFKGDFIGGIDEMITKYGELVTLLEPSLAERRREVAPRIVDILEEAGRPGGETTTINNNTFDITVTSTGDARQDALNIIDEIKRFI